MAAKERQGCESSMFYTNSAIYSVSNTFEPTSSQMKELNLSGIAAVAWWPMKGLARGITPTSEVCAGSPDPHHQPILVLIHSLVQKFHTKYILT